jgi:hypothetical protein
MEDSKLQKLHETLKALAPKGKVGGLGFYAKAGHRSRRSAADGMPEDKRALYSFFVRAGDGPSGHTHFADEGDKKLKKKKKKKKTKAPPPPSSDESSSSSSEDEAPPPPKKTKKRKEAAARLADIDAAYDSAQAAKARSIDEAFAASQSAAAPKKKKKKTNGAAPVKKEKKRKKSKKKDR